MKASKRLKTLALAAIAPVLLMASAAKADIVGYFVTTGGGVNAGVAGAITASGNTAVALTNLTAGDLAGIDVLWILNSNNGDPGTAVMNNVAAVADFVAGGHTLSFHDRNVNQGISAGRYVPGAGSVTFTASFGTNIDVVTANAVTAGITNTNLDGGNFSNHGYATLASLPVGAVAVLNNGTAGQIVDFYYQYGAGNVYYSTIPLDFYLAGAGNNPPADTFRTVYAPQEVGFQASLTQVPEPTGLGLLSLALIGFALTMRRRQAA